MSCNSSIAVIRIPFKDNITPEDIKRILEKIEPTLSVDEWEGKIEYMSVDEEKATFRPRRINKRWYIERIIDYNYEECGDFDVTLNKNTIDDYLSELKEVEGLNTEAGYVFRAYVWYNGTDEPM